MHSSIQPCQKRFAPKFWKGDSKRRNSTPIIKKEGQLSSNDVKTALNYQTEEQNKLINEYNAAKDRYDLNNDLILTSAPCLELLNKLRMIRTSKMAQIDNFENNNPKLETFFTSYSKDFVIYKSKYEGFNKYHLRHISMEDSFNVKDIPIYDNNREIEPKSSSNDVMKQWANQSFSKIQPDHLLTGLLSSLSPDIDERQSRKLREKYRQKKIFTLYAAQNYIRQIDDRGNIDFPEELVGKSFKVHIKSFRLEPDLEPIFGHMCLYDLKNRKKISENFYFDINSKTKLSMVDEKTRLQFLECEPQADSCVFHVSNPSDIFLLIRVEKILQQGDANDIAESYLRDDKHKAKLQTEIEWAWKHHTKYRMPFGILAIELQNVLTGNDKTASSFQSSNSIDNCSLNSKTSSVKSARTSINTKRHPLESATIKTTSRSLSKDMYLMPSSVTDDDQFNYLYQNMIPTATHINHLYRQEFDKMSEEDLFKWLQECKKSGSNAKRLKTIPCHMDLEISPIDEMNSSELILSPEELPLATKYQRHSKQTAAERPIIDVLEFPAEKRFIANAIYRNLLYVYPKSVNFGSKQGSNRNIAIKTQILHTDGDKMRVLPMIFNKSYGSKLSSETVSKVLYHIKSPDFNDEIKVKLPAIVTGNIFLLFTFYHISCQASKKNDTEKTDVSIGYSWLPLLDNNILHTAEHSLMISLDRPLATAALQKPDLQNNIENVRWLDNHKELFRVLIQPVSTVHSDDRIIEQFNNVVSDLRSMPKTGISDSGDKNSLKDALIEVLQKLDNCKLDGLIQFSSIILDNLLWLSVDASLQSFSDQADVKQHFFNVLANVVNRITVQSTNKNERLNRDAVLSTYVLYAASIPRSVRAEASSHSSIQSQLKDSVTSVNLDNPYIATGIFHEDLLSRVLQSMASVSTDIIIDNIWFFLELLIRAMKEYFHNKSQSRHFNRNNAFSDNFLLKLSRLIKTATEQLERYVQIKDYNASDDYINILSPQQIKKCQILIRNLALFHNDLITMLNHDVIRSFMVNFIVFINSKVIAEPKAVISLYVKCKLEFLLILSCSEYFLHLNGIDLQKSLCNPNSHITESYVVKHLPLGLILTELKLCLQTSDPNLHTTAVEIILNLLASHESDPRYESPGSLSKISDMYLPLVNVLFDILKHLMPQKSNLTKASSHHCPDNGSMSSADYSSIRSSTGAQKSIISDSLYDSIEEEVDNYLWSGILDYEETEYASLNSRHLLLCFIWLLKNLDSQNLAFWVGNLSSFKVNKLLHLLLLAVVNFEYKALKNVRSVADSYQSSTIDLVSTDDAMKDIEKLSNAVSKNDMASVMEVVLCREIIFVILDTLEAILKVFEKSSQAIPIIINILRIIIKALGVNQSVDAIQGLLSFQRIFIRKHHKILFDEYIDLCGDLCKCLLTLAGSDLKEIRSHAVASLYMIMRYNFQLDSTFARIKLQITMALSRLVGDTNNTKRKNIEINLNSSLRTMIAYGVVESEQYSEQLGNGDDSYIDYLSFASQVQELTLNLHNILNDTVKMRQFQEDPEMHIDLMSRIAKGYQNSPDLRLTWLQMMKNKHKELKNHAEAGMCIAHCAGIVAEYLGMKEPLPYMPVGCVQIADALGTNLLEESATSDDVVSPDEDGMCCDHLFCQEGLITLIRSARKYFKDANMFELIPKINRIILPILEEQRDYNRLSRFHDEIKEAYDNIIENTNKRIFATYFRVGFYGKGFQDLDNQEYIYKELPYSKLAEISSKIEAFYSTRFVKDSLVIIKDSSNVDLSTLDNDKNYLQIIFVEPYFETAELRRRITVFDRNYNLKKFVYSTPYTKDGKSHGELRDQYKRKTILITEKSFPYIKTRILVIGKSQLDLTPIEVALEDLSKKVEQLSLVLSQHPIDAKYLQMMLQGAIGTTVNQGPVELANSFLSTTDMKSNGYHCNKLKMCFKEFLRRCKEGLQKNKLLITPDQFEYQKELEKNFQEISKQLHPLLYGNGIVNI